MARMIVFLLVSAWPPACLGLQNHLQRVAAGAEAEAGLFCCSGHGHRAPLLNFACVCNAGWAGSDCSAPAAPPQNVSAACYNPGGSNGVATCAWYSVCLAERFPGCEDHAHEYAISFGQKYCQRFTDNAARFSSAGQIWIESVKLCLQEELVTDVLSPSVNVADCTQIRRTAFDSHPRCYVQPDKSDPSIGICHLMVTNPRDIVLILETTWDALLALESVKQIIDTAIGCALQALQHIVKPLLLQDGYSEVAALIDSSIHGNSSDVIDIRER
uniref:EGF-like domain-containing protein n=1 Tax=Zooxanthella nutricula TaxID=1333877 RepID=A0A7S2VKU4_9DINO